MNDFQMHISPDRQTLGALAAETEVVFPARPIELPTVIVHTNAEWHTRPDINFMTMCGPYRARTAQLDPVVIHRMPPGATVLGGNSSLVRVDGTLVHEWVSPLITDIAAVLESIAEHARRSETVDRPCLLVARFGEVTWGHWLAEILPAAIVAEHAHPGRFTYVVPGHTTRPDVYGTQRDYATAVLESLAAYGIGEDRLLRMEHDCNYRFGQLHIAGGLWSPGVMSPDVVALMRTAIVLPVPDAAPGGHRVALLRPKGENRSVFNHDDITALLHRQGFLPVDIGALSFLRQVAVFRHAEAICGSLGSGLTGLIYARDGVRLTSIGPADWFDFYFYMLMQLRSGVYVDFRGPVVWSGQKLPRDAPIAADPAQLERALAAMDNAPVPATARSVTVCGVELPIRPDPGFFSIDFSAAGASAAYRAEGWSVQEAHSIWSTGSVSRLLIPMAEIGMPAGGGWFLELCANTFTVPPCLVSRILGVVVNGHHLASFELRRELLTIGCRIPRAAIDGQAMLEIVFVHPVCPPATFLGAGPDDRALGIGCVSLRLRNLPIQIATSLDRDQPEPRPKAASR